MKIGLLQTAFLGLVLLTSVSRASGPWLKLDLIVTLDQEHSAKDMDTSHDTQYLVTRFHDYDGKRFTQIYDIRTANVVHSINDVEYGRLSPISHNYVYTSKDTMYSVDIRTGITSYTRPAQGQIYFSEDGLSLGIVSNKGITILDGVNYDLLVQQDLPEDIVRVKDFQFSPNRERSAFVQRTKDKMDTALVVDKNLKTIWRLEASKIDKDYSHLFVSFLPNNRILVVASNLCEWGNCPDAIARAEIWDFENNRKVQDLDMKQDALTLRDMARSYTTHFQVLWNSNLCVLSTNEGRHDLFHFYDCQSFQKLGQMPTHGNLMSFTINQQTSSLISNIYSLEQPSYVNIYSFISR